MVWIFPTCHNSNVKKAALLLVLVCGVVATVSAIYFNTPYIKDPDPESRWRYTSTETGGNLELKLNEKFVKTYGVNQRPTPDVKQLLIDKGFTSPTWNIVYSTEDLSAAFTIDNYKIFQDSDKYGASLQGRVNSIGTVSPASIRFIQVLTTTSPANNQTSPYIDAVPYDDPATPEKESLFDAAPFYNDIRHDALVTDGSTPDGMSYKKLYGDAPKRPRVVGTNVSWRAQVYVVLWSPSVNFDSPGGTITIYDGFSWGWDAIWTTSGGSGGAGGGS